MNEKSLRQGSSYVRRTDALRGMGIQEESRRKAKMRRRGTKKMKRIDSFFSKNVPEEEEGFESSPREPRGDSRSSGEDGLYDEIHDEGDPGGGDLENQEESDLGGGDLGNQESDLGRGDLENQGESDLAGNDDGNQDEELPMSFISGFTSFKFDKDPAKWLSTKNLITSSNAVASCETPILTSRARGEPTTTRQGNGGQIRTVRPRFTPT